MKWKEVIKDFRSGKLDPQKVMVAIDNDGGYWQSFDECEAKAEEIQLELEAKYGSPEGYNDVVDILEAAGVRAEWC